MFNPSSDPYHTLTLGYVVDTNDPQQMGRIRARIAAFGDTVHDPVCDIPWCYYVSPLGGMVQSNAFTRGPNDARTDQTTTTGPVAYGMFNVPKIGASVIVSCLDGDPMARIWLGCIHIEQTTHTLPHGRFAYNPDNIDSEKYPTKGEPEGPFSSEENKIQPLYDNLSKAFGSRKDNYEYRSRGADHSATGLGKQIASLDDYVSKKVEDENYIFAEKDGHTITSRQGYKISRQEPDVTFPESTNGNYDSTVYCWVTPGFHAFSMDDAADNCRVRIRTTTGHQIILDDTNERIYVSTNEGLCWMEMDSDGSVDLYSKQRVSIHSENDINMTSDKSIRMFANEGIHLTATEEVRIKAEQDIHIVTNANLRVQAIAEIRMAANGNLQILTQSEMRAQAASGMHLTGGSQILATATVIHANGPSATGAASAEALLAFYTNRVPQHEPWARTSTASDFTHEPLYPYDDPNVGKEHKSRGKYWHR